MLQPKLLLFLLASFSVTLTSAGTPDRHAQSKTTVASPDEDLYDVKYVKMDIEATNLSTAITGHVRTRAKVTASTMGVYVFELSPQLTIDSAKVDGVLYPVVQNGFVNTITLATSLAQNTNFNSDIYYHGAPTGGTGFFTNGILHQYDASIPVDVTHTVSAAIHSRDWWPCKQSLTDKIDSADIWVTVPTGLKVAGNGLLQNVTPVTGGNRYEWATRYLADYYLLSFAIAPYQEYSYYMHFTGSNDSMLVQNYLYNIPAVLANHQDELDSTALVIDHFSTLFGRYPFDKEKFGICMSPLGGGMENQTMVTLGDLNMELIAHELSHQWWGDHVTCASLKDMWLNEGMATYCEQLFIEHFRPAQLLGYRTTVFNQAMAGSGGSVYVDDTTDELRVYDSRLTYAKGAAVAHMLRFVADDDNAYFSLLQQYQQLYGFGNATTEDMKTLAEQVLNQDLDSFFNQWVYKEGHPIYAAKWNQTTSQEVFVRLTQTTSKPASISCFKTPLEIKLTSATGDTVIRVFNDQNIQNYSFQWGRTMTGIVVDPNNNILNKLGFITHDPTLSVVGLSYEPIEIYPNPSSAGWNVKGLPSNATLTLADITGKKIWEQTAAADSVFVPSATLSSGSYILTLMIKDRQPVSYQLRK
jgi:aminopeptidase N